MAVADFPNHSSATKVCWSSRKANGPLLTTVTDVDCTDTLPVDQLGLLLCC